MQIGQQIKNLARWRLFQLIAITCRNKRIDKYVLFLNTMLPPQKGAQKLQKTTLCSFTYHVSCTVLPNILRQKFKIK